MPLSFAPVIGKKPRIMILGSMPGIRSLQEQQYYAHPRNAFWPIMHKLYGIDTGLAYEKRLSLLTRKGIILWDVLHQCEREGSLDSAIASHSEIPNAIPELLEHYRDIERILLNGGKAASVFRKHVAGVLPRHIRAMIIQLPSTSPANARMDFDEKLSRWRYGLGL